jgi:purine-binding chemotaxis protein CheW
MNRDAALSSEQALDDYFTALLDEESAALELAEQNSQEESVSGTQTSHMVPQLQPEPKVDNRSAESEEAFDFPDFDDVQRLLNQLETSNSVDEIEGVTTLLEKNTQEIASYQAESTVSVQIEDEIQDWDIDVGSEEIADVTTDVALENALSVQPDIREDLVQETDQQDMPETQTGGLAGLPWHSTKRIEDFQVLYFGVHGVTFAVPLDELGGIHRLEETSHLLGRPAWYLGLQTNRDQQLDVVDTARWVMPEKLSDDSHQSDYQYIVMLGDSMWGLAGDQLKGTEWLGHDEIRWREQAGKRPWLAGMVKEKMCALIHVEALIAMLNAGLDVKALDN